MSTIVLLLASLSGAGPGPNIRFQDAQPILDEVVDSLPYFISRLWGYEQDKPYTIVLNRRVLSEFLSGAPKIPLESHDERWLEIQERKPFVRGLCTVNLLESGECPIGEATMVVGISKPIVEGDTATVYVRMARPDKGSIGPHYDFFAGLRVIFRRTEGGWAYRNYRRTIIT